MWLGLTWVQFAIDRLSGIHFFFHYDCWCSFWRDFCRYYIFRNKKNNLFSAHWSIEHKNALFHSLETVLMKEEEKKLLFLCRQERKYKKSCDVNSLTHLFFEKAFNLSSIQVLQCNKESCLQCAFILCSMCMDIHFTQLTLGQAGVSQ